MKSFAELNLSAGLLKAIAEMGFEEPTPIQEMTIPAALEGRDIIGQAQTGTGKTASFAVPVIEKKTAGSKPYALILEPTRELAIQVAEEIGRLSKFKSRSVLTVYGGSSLERQVKALRSGVNIVVGTPGRVLDHLNRKTLSLVRHLHRRARRGGRDARHGVHRGHREDPRADPRDPADDALLRDDGPRDREDREKAHEGPAEDRDQPQGHRRPEDRPGLLRGGPAGQDGGAHPAAGRRVPGADARVLPHQARGRRRRGVPSSSSGTTPAPCTAISRRRTAKR